MEALQPLIEALRRSVKALRPSMEALEPSIEALQPLIEALQPKVLFGELDVAAREAAVARLGTVGLSPKAETGVIGRAGATR